MVNHTHLVDAATGRMMFNWVQPWRNASVLPDRRVLAVFIHFSKCAGTAVRSLFVSSGAWRLAPYCISPTRVMHGLRATGNQSSTWTFWEVHCSPSIRQLVPLLNATTRLSAEQAGSPLMMPLVFSFTSIRHPVDLVMSEHNYFHHRECPLASWAARNPELLLGSRFLDLPGRPRRPYRTNCSTPLEPEPPISEAQCDEYEAEALRLLSLLDHVAFVEAAESYAPIALLAGFPTSTRQLGLRRSNNGRQKVGSADGVVHGHGGGLQSGGTGGHAFSAAASSLHANGATPFTGLTLQEAKRETQPIHATHRDGVGRVAGQDGVGVPFSSATPAQRQLPWLNVHCKACHEAPVPWPGRQQWTPSNASWSEGERRLRRVVEGFNSCSLRVYAALRRSRASPSHEDGRGEGVARRWARAVSLSS
jgi:hypothetical protein